MEIESTKDITYELAMIDWEECETRQSILLTRVEFLELKKGLARSRGNFRASVFKNTPEEGPLPGGRADGRRAVSRTESQGLTMAAFHGRRTEWSTPHEF
jgi:hypothetical protein